jgi:sugar phosphate isomerase/epimerase
MKPALGIVGHHLSVGTGLGLEDAARIARRLGAETFEISAIPTQVAERFSRETAADYGDENAVRNVQVDADAASSEWKQAGETLERAGLTAGALGGYNDFASPEADTEVEKERVIRFCRMAGVLGTDVIRVFGGDVTQGAEGADESSRRAALKRIIGCFKDVIGFAEKANLYLAIENHLRLVNDADSLLQIIEAVGSPNLKVTLDFTNFYWLNNDIKQTQRMIARVAPHTIHTHFKNARIEGGRCVFTSLGQGDLNIEWIMKVLRDSGYDRPYFIACESEDFTNISAVEKGFAQSIRYLRKLLAED